MDKRIVYVVTDKNGNQATGITKEEALKYLAYRQQQSEVVDI